MTISKFDMKNKLPIPVFGVIIAISVFFVYQTFFSESRPSLKVAPTQLSSEGVDEAAHAMEAIPDTDVAKAKNDKGLEELSYKLDGSTKVFRLTAQPIRWKLFDKTYATAWAYNGAVPGPLIHVTDGDKVRIIVKNNLPEPTTIHWHGVLVPNNMDGIPDETQKPIQPGESFTYEFVAKPAGTFWYHSHFNTDKQIGIGLSGAFIIEPKGGLNPKPDIDKVLMLNEWRILGKQTYPAMPATDMDANLFTINGKAFPDTENITAKVGQKVRLRFIGAGQLIHPMHLHGFPFKIVATDGNDVPLSAQWTKDVISVAPGERYDVEFTPDRPGKWMLHCHIPHHTTNFHKEPGGLMMMINVTN